MSGEKRKGGARLSKPESKKPAPRRQGGGQAAAPRKGMKTWAKVLIIIFAILVATVLAFLVWYKFFWAVMPDQPELPDLPSVSLAPPNAGNGESPAPAEAVNSPRKKDFYTFLLVGRDTGGGGNTDTIMLVSYDIPNQHLSILSIPRDTMVDARHPGQNRKINAVYNLGRYFADAGDERKGIDYLKEAVGDMMGFTPDFYVIVNWEAFGRLVDAIGGVDFDVPRNMNYDDPAQDLHIHQTAGWRHLTGNDAMQIVRWRHDNYFAAQYADGDLGRIRTQQNLLKAIVKQCLKLENVKNIREFAQIFSEEVETDLTLGNLVAFAERAILGGLDMENVQFKTVPVDGTYVSRTSYVQARPEELLAILNESMNPYKEDLSLENLDVMRYNTDTGRFYTTRGNGTPRH